MQETLNGENDLSKEEQSQRVHIHSKTSYKAIIIKTVSSWPLDYPWAKNGFQS